MKKTISVLLCKRVEYGRQVLEAIKAAKGVEDWEVNIYCDIPGHMTDFMYRRSSVRVAAKEVVIMANSFDFVNSVSVATKPMGLKEATRWCLKDTFKNKNSDYNLHIEDDILISEDALFFVEQCYPYLSDTVGSVSLVGYKEKEKPSSEEMMKVRKKCWFDCGWGWAMKKDFYNKNFEVAPKMGHAASWAADINALFRGNNISELFSLARRSKNIGRDFSTHVMSVDNGLNCLDVRDEWNGGDHGSSFNLDFSEVSD